MKLHEGLLKKGLLLAGISLLSFSISSSYATASSSNEVEKAPTIVSTENLNYAGEDFELVKMQASDGTFYYTIPTEVENKGVITDYVNNHLKDELNPDRMSIMGTTFPWSESYDKSDREGRLQWNVSGFHENAYLAPITANRKVINDGQFLASFGGSGNPDKIYVSYSYTFKGTTLSISAPPSLNEKNDKITWKSDAYTGTWFASGKTLGAEASSRTLMYNTDIAAEAEIYKGSYVYRPYVRDNKF